MGVVLANVSHIVTAESVNYLKRMLNTCGSLFGGQGPKVGYCVSEACVTQGMGHIFCIIFTVGTLQRQNNLTVMVSENIRCSPIIYDLSIFLLSGYNHLITGLGKTALRESNT